MNVEALMLQSLQLLGLGMGSVFIILTLLIGIITIISKLVPEVEVPQVETRPVNTTKTEHIAVIQAAIQQFRRRH